MTELACHRKRDGKALVLALEGALTSATATRFLREFDRALGDGAPAIALDLARIEAMDSAGAAALVEAWARAERRGVPLRVNGLSEAARTRLAIVGVLDHLAPA